MSIPSLPDIGADKIPSHVRSANLAVIEDVRPSNMKSIPKPKYTEDDDEDSATQNFTPRLVKDDGLSKLLTLKSVQTVKDRPEAANKCLEWLYDICKEDKVNVMLTLTGGITITIQAQAIFEDTNIDSITLFVAKNNDLSINIPQALQMSLSWNGKTSDCIYMGRLQPGEKFPFNLMTFLVQSPQ